MAPKVVKRDAADEIPPIQWRVWGGAGVGPAAAGATLRGKPEAGIDPELVVRAQQEAFERGRREGEAAAARALAEQVHAAAAGFAQAAAALAGYKNLLRTEVERELVQLAMAVARRILRREVSLDPAVVLAVVRSCLADLTASEIYRLRLHPQDVEPVQSWLRQNTVDRVEVLSDGAVSRGGALFETARGALDARLETQLIEIEHGLADQ